MRYASFSAITVSGFAGAIGQVLILRELLVLFYGNELSTGLIFTCWLVWTALGSGLAGRLSGRIASIPAALSICLAVLALQLPLTILWIRASRVIWSIPTGEMVGPGLMLAICFSSTAVFCLTSGFLFALAWSVQTAGSGNNEAASVMIYLGEAVGAAVGGLSYYFLLLPRVPALSTAWMVAGILAATAFVLMGRCRRPLAFRFFWFTLGLIALCAGVWAAFVLSPGQDSLSRRWQWGTDPLIVRDTPYHNLALLKNTDQFTLFANGLWLFSAPDIQTAEYAVHPALLQHPDPRRVLVLGGGVAGLLDEILKHPNIEAVDYVEPDPEVIRLAEEFLPSSLTAPIHDPRIHLFHTDGSSFIRSTPNTYDVVLLNAGDPMNAEVNRFYTFEFYNRMRRLLNPGGILSFGVSSAPDIIGPAQARFLCSIYRTLSSAFPFVMVYPGESTRFFASDRSQNLVADARELVDRIGARGLQLRYVREYYLFDYLSPMRLAYMASVLADNRSMAVNLDFAPTCYFNNLVVWSAQIHPGIEKTLVALSEVKRSWFWAGLGGVILFVLVAFRMGRPAREPAVRVSVLVMGATQMMSEIILLLAFQILEGFVYTQLALIITFFMAGIALGAAAIERLSSWINRPRRWLVFVQSAFCIYLPVLTGIFYLLHNHFQAPYPRALPVPMIFSLLALLSGVLGGLHFSLAVKVLSFPTCSPEEEGGAHGAIPIPALSVAEAGATLYALDLAGAAVGALTASLFLLPIYGLFTALATMALLLLTSLAMLTS